MPKEVKDIRDFLLMMKRKDVKSIMVHKKMTTAHSPAGRHISGASKQITKFKLRGARYLYTLTLDNKDKATKLAASLPSHLVKYSSDKPAAKK